MGNPYFVARRPCARTAGWTPLSPSPSYVFPFAHPSRGVASSGTLLLLSASCCGVHSALAPINSTRRSRTHYGSLVQPQCKTRKTTPDGISVEDRGELVSLRRQYQFPINQHSAARCFVIAHYDEPSASGAFSALSGVIRSEPFVIAAAIDNPAPNVFG